MPKNFEKLNQNESIPETNIEASKYIEPHDEVYEKYPDDLLFNDWWTNLPGGRKKIGDMIDKPIGDYYKTRAKLSAKKDGLDEDDLYKAYISGEETTVTEKRLRLSDYEFRAIVEQKMKEAGVDVEEIRHMNERLNQIDDMWNREIGSPESKERDNLLRDMNKKTGVVRRMLMRDGFSSLDLQRG